MTLVQLHFALFAARSSILIEFVPHCLPLPVIKLPQLGKFPSLSSANSADPRYDDYDYRQDWGATRTLPCDTVTLLTRCQRKDSMAIYYNLMDMAPIIVCCDLMITIALARLINTQPMKQPVQCHFSLARNFSTINTETQAWIHRNQKSDAIFNFPSLSAANSADANIAQTQTHWSIKSSGQLIKCALIQFS